MSTATEIASIKKTIEELNGRFEIIEQRLTKLELAQNDFIKKTKEIKKGIGTKVAFDSNGLIINNLELEPKDIPEISINKVKELNHLTKKVKMPLYTNCTKGSLPFYLFN